MLIAWSLSPRFSLFSRLLEQGFDALQVGLLRIEGRRVARDGGLQQLRIDQGEQSAFLDDAVEIDVDLLDRPGSEGADRDGRTGLTVPVELTTVSTRPRDTAAVTYFGSGALLQPGPCWNRAGRSRADQNAQDQ